MKPTHTSEPWKVVRSYTAANHSAQTCWVQSVNPPLNIARVAIDGELWSKTPEFNAERIVACVNACDGINPAAVPEIVDALERLLACACPTGMDTETDRAMEQARAALAKAKE